MIKTGAELDREYLRNNGYVDGAVLDFIGEHDCNISPGPWVATVSGTDGPYNHHCSSCECLFPAPHLSYCQYDEHSTEVSFLNFILQYGNGCPIGYKPIKLNEITIDTVPVSGFISFRLPNIGMASMWANELIKAFRPREHDVD